MQTIGRRDKIDFPDLELLEMDVKIDTGARTSSLHCDEIYELEKDGVKILHFKILDPRHPVYEKKEFEFRKYDKRKVKSSSGHVEDRFVIKTSVIIFGKTFNTEFTLTNRKKMNFPVLLGRRLLRKKFIVDVSKTNLSHRLKNDETSI